jgi:hypothetical protein
VERLDGTPQDSLPPTPVIAVRVEKCYDVLAPGYSLEHDEQEGKAEQRRSEDGGCWRAICKPLRQPAKGWVGWEEERRGKACTTE